MLNDYIYKKEQMGTAMKNIDEVIKLKRWMTVTTIWGFDTEQQITMSETTYLTHPMSYQDSSKHRSFSSLGLIILTFPFPIRYSRKLVTDFCENLHKRVSKYSLQSQVRAWDG